MKGEKRYTTLIDELLEEQRRLTAVEKFSRAHERHELATKEKHYRSLLPTSAPAPGQQYAFEVDLDKCSGCKACVTACHSLNGLDDNETWRSVGLLISPEVAPLADGRSALRAPHPAFYQHVTTACHHCVDPGCLNGCPVLAYDKDPATGIVRHLDDQCIGCQYCVMKCPYEVPQYSAARGIVRKCDMCSSRLAVGEAPACVQACPNEAIRIEVVDQKGIECEYRVANDQGPRSKVQGSSDDQTGGSTSEPGASLDVGHRSLVIPNFLPAAPDAAITLPTTRYVSSRPLPADLLAGDDASVRPAQAHLPLVALLVLTQLAASASVAAVFAKNPAPLLLVALIAGAVGLVTGTLHLGQPLKAWRSFLGWRKSWFSREVIVFGAFVPLVALALLTALVLNDPRSSRGNETHSFLIGWSLFTSTATAQIAAVTGLLGVFCSAMIYADTRREFWSARQSLTKFFGTTLLLGAVAALAFVNPASSTLAVLVILSAAAKLTFEHRIFRHRVDDETPGQPPLGKTARLLAGELAGLGRARIACGLLGGIALPGVTLLSGLPAISFVALALCVTGELIERHLFFTAVAARKMPGGINA